FVAFVQLGIGNFAGCNSALFLPAQEGNYAEYFLLGHGRPEGTHGTPQRPWDTGRDGDVDLGIGVSGVLEYTAAQTRTLAAVAIAAVTERAALRILGLALLHDLHVVGGHFHIVFI